MVSPSPHVSWEAATFTPVLFSLRIERMINSLKSIELLTAIIAAGLAYLIITMFSGYFQAWVAKKLGDDTAQEAGFLTLNPVIYLDPIGFMLFLVTGFGWGKPVPINPFNFTGKYRRLEILFTYGSQTVANAVLAIFCLWVMTVFFGGMTGTRPLPTYFVDHPAIAQSLRLVAYRMAEFSIFFTLYSLVLACLRMAIMFWLGQFKMMWHESELISVLLAILLLFVFNEPLFFLMKWTVIHAESFMWSWWTGLIGLFSR